jgi:ATP-dependent DNA helicase RecG
MDIHSKVCEIFRLSEFQQKALKKLGVETAEDILYHFPSRYGETAEMRTISSLKKGDSAVVYGRIEKLKASKGFRTKITMADGILSDDTGKIKCVWFNQPYLAKMISDGSPTRVEGKVSAKRSDGSLYFSNPKIENIAKIPISTEESLLGESADSHFLKPLYTE